MAFGKWWCLFISVPRSGFFAEQESEDGGIVRVGELLRGVPRHDVNDEAGRQFGSGSSSLLPGMYHPRTTVELATSEILPSEAVQAPQNCTRRSLRTHRKRRRWPDSP